MDGVVGRLIEDLIMISVEKSIECGPRTWQSWKKRLLECCRDIVVKFALGLDTFPLLGSRSEGALHSL
jgi:hypothetical protein